MTEFPNPISLLIANHFEEVLKHFGIINGEKINYYLIPYDSNEKLKSFDEMISFWQTPKISGFRISKEMCLNFLSSAKNEAPIWIKTYYEKDSLILEFSQRFRKLAVIKEANPNNNLAPFNIQPIGSCVLGKIRERESLIRSKLFDFRLDDALFRLVGSKISEYEYFDFLENHFKSYRFYPPLYNDFKSNEKNYSSLVIEKDFNNNLYSIFRNGKEDEKILNKATLKEVGLKYLNDALNWKIDNIIIEKNESNALRKIAEIYSANND